MGDDCSLECRHPLYKIKRAAKPFVTGEVHEFVGPVKIVLVDPPPGEYEKKTWGAAFVALAYVAIGAAVFPVFMYTSHFHLELMNNLHVLLCTMGYELFIPAAFLTMNRYNSASHLMKANHRRWDYLLLKIIGFICAGAGTTGIIMGKDGIMKFTSAHALTGLIAGGLAFLDLLSIPCILFHQNHFLAKFSYIVGVPSLIAASACFSLGILTKTYQDWVPVYNFVELTIFFCCFYTLVIIFDPLTKFFFSGNIFRSFRKK